MSKIRRESSVEDLINFFFFHTISRQFCVSVYLGPVRLRSLLRESAFTSLIAKMEKHATVPPGFALPANIEVKVSRA